MPVNAPIAQATPASAASFGAPRRRQKRRAKDGDQIGAVALTEEAFHLLRTTPLTTLWLYYLGAIPFVLGVFVFWADMSRSSYAERDAAIGAVGLAAVYLWMKFWQGRFCRQLWQQLHPSGNQAEFSARRYARYFAAQAFLHAFALPTRLLSLIFIGWTVAFFQNVSVLAFSQDFGRQPLRKVLRLSARFAQENWMQNYLILLLVVVMSVFIWANLLGAVVLIPMGLKIFFGIETVFTLNPESTILSTPFLFGSFLLAFLIVDPLLKAIYTLRCFRSLSRHTGADLISRLDRVKLTNRGSAMSVLLISLLALSLSLTTPVKAADEVAREPALEMAPPTSDDLARSITETLRDKEYQWRLPKQELDGSVDAQKGWLATVMSDLADSFERATKRVSDAVSEFFRKIFEGKRASRSEPIPGGAGLGAGVGVVAQGLFIALLVGLLIWVGYLLVNHSRRERLMPIDDIGPAGPIDLESDQIVATQLPEDEWMRLAREQIAKGEHRLAVRALFLASLAHLGDRGLLRVARFKSNRDYTRELSLKARTLPELQSAFGENVGLFERVWYGLHEIGRDAIDRFTANYERITVKPPSSENDVTTRGAGGTSNPSQDHLR
ncbi:MAG: DUF4129 domain-containing protein [Verrucomicrobiae bacterium]|nr:DUF4129 domain-containing protein [Verrucomicrobiae bacterium]